MARDLLRDLRTVLDLSRALGAERDLDRLLARIVAAVSDLAEAERTSLFVVDAARGELWTRIAEGAGEIRLPIGQGIAGKVAADGATINIAQAYDDSRFDPANDRRTGFRTRSILCMALRNHAGGVVGVLQALNKRDGEPFDADDEQVLAALAAQAGVALDNARLIASERERQRMLHDMELARRIQLGLLPDAMPVHPGWRCAAFSRSCDQTGGDYHDAIPRGDGIDLVVGDVSGHGIAAALLMSTARASLRALHGAVDDPAELMTRLNRLLEQDMSDDAFMSMALARLGGDGSVVLVLAGHEAPLVWRAATAAFDTIGTDGLLLGMIDDASYGVQAIAPLAPGDCLVLLTDGIFEAQRRDGPVLGLERVQAAIAAHARLGPEAVRDAIVAAVDGWLGGEPAHDDLTLVVAIRA